MALVEVQNLSFTYPRCAAPALGDVSFSLEKGDFAVICGATGSGKSTLLRCLKRELTPKGALTGEIRLDGRPLAALSDRESAGDIGFVFQRPQQQIVTDKVWHELAFGLENLGLPQEAIRRRVAETAAFFGMEDWFDRPVSALSGGQQQILNLAAVMTLQPRLLLLDEPTAQLDPIAATGFLSALQRLNRELGLTILLIEHRLEEAIPVSNRVLALEGGRMLAFGETRMTARQLCAHPVLGLAMPAAARLAHALRPETAPFPLTVREGRQLLEALGPAPHPLPPAPVRADAPEALRFSGVYFRYERSAPDTLSDLSFTVRAGELTCLLGGNGAGKSTALLCAAGLLRPYAGQIAVFGKKLKSYPGQSLYRDCLALLPQDVQTLFLRNSVAQELQDAGADAKAFPFDFGPLLSKHPYDLSGGEQQALGLCKALAAHPRLLLLDEPTKGLDAFAKARLGRLLLDLKKQGLTILCVTHDVEFAAQCADQCALFFRGQVISQDAPRAFFSCNSFYTTAVNRMARDCCPGAITADELAAAYGKGAAE